MSMSGNVQAKRAAFRALHTEGCFVLPNPWDIGSAVMLQGLGFRAIASTSSGFAWSTGHADGASSREEVLAHLRTLCGATDLPVNADFESGYAVNADGVGESVRLAIATGVAGLSIEDSTGDKDNPLYEFDLSVARIRAARAAIDKAGGEVLLTARSEGFLVGRPDIDETIRRLKAFAAAGADCLYAPGLRTRELIGALINAVAPKPVNIIMSGPLGITVAELAALGTRRISVGSALSRVAWGAFIRAAKQIAEEGRFDAFADGAPHPELNAFFRDDMKKRQQ
jgi:2-methylisocitrate lyase-like PEP mutase family enzyme